MSFDPITNLREALDYSMRVRARDLEAMIEQSRVDAADIKRLCVRLARLRLELIEVTDRAEVTRRNLEYLGTARGWPGGQDD